MAVITSVWTLDALLFLPVLVLGIYLYVTRNYNYWSKRGVKALKPTFFFGNAAPCVFAKQTPLVFLSDVYQKGEGEQLIGFYVFDKPYLMVRDPELIKHIFVKDFHNFSNKLICDNDKDVLGTANLFLIRNPPWKYLRQKLTSIFTSGKLKKMYELMMEICQDMRVLLDELDIDEKVGKPIEVKEICAKFTTDIIGTTAFGMNFNSLKDPDAEFRKYGKAMFRSTFKRYLEMLAILFIPSLRPYTYPKFFDDKGTEFLRKTFWEVINNRIKSGIKRPDLLDLLIEIRNNQENDDNDKYKLEGDTLVAQAAIFFSGGFETSSTTMSFTLYELAMHPEIQTKLREEILEGLASTDGKITYDMVTKLPYLDMVVHEALRMYPILAWLDRLPETDYTFPGTNITVEQNTPLILPMRALHMDPQYFPDPEKFEPERFSQENRKNITPFAYFPFGEGPRNCIGSRLGLIQTKLGIINFISKFELTPCKDTCAEIDNLSLFTHTVGGLYLNLRTISD